MLEPLGATAAPPSPVAVAAQQGPGQSDGVGDELLRFGAVTKFFSRALFDRAVSALTAEGYRVHVVDTSSAQLLREQLTRVLRFKEKFGYEPWTGNSAALTDAFRELDFASVAGIVLAFARFDRLHAQAPAVAHGVLDILERASRDYLLAGARLIGLVQSDEPRLEIAPVGARAPEWNDAEWFNARRGL